MTIIDGRGSPKSWIEGFNQAIALKADGIVTDCRHREPSGPDQGGAASRISSWSASTAAAFPGPNKDLGLFDNIQQDPREIGRAQADWIIADIPSGKARVVVTSHCEFQIACTKAHATEDRIQECKGCEVLEFSNSPISEVAQRQPPLVTAWVQKYGTPLYITSVADYTADFQIPALRAGGVDPKEVILVSADGNKSAYERIRAGGQYQLVTASRALRDAGLPGDRRVQPRLPQQPPCGCVQRPIWSRRENINAEGGDKNTFIPSNDYEEHYLDALGVSVKAASVERRGGTCPSGDRRHCSRSAGLDQALRGTLALDARRTSTLAAGRGPRRCWARTAPASRR